MLGEVCHFVDLCALPRRCAARAGDARALGRDPAIDDSVVASLGFADGSTATIQYLAHASGALPKERIEVSGDGARRSATTSAARSAHGSRGARSFTQDKGQQAAVASVVGALREGRPSPIPFAEIESVSRATLRLADAAASGTALRVEPRIRSALARDPAAAALRGLVD